MIRHFPRSISVGRGPLAIAAVDPALQSIYVWGNRDGFLETAHHLGRRWGSRTGPVVRIPVSASPRDLDAVLDTEQTFVRGFPCYRPGIVARAKGGVLYIASADLLRADTAAALVSTLGTLTLEQRPLLIASSDGPPEVDCPVASVCAFWVDGTRPLRELDGQRPDPVRGNEAAWDEPVVSDARARLYEIPLTIDIIEMITKRTADSGWPAPTVDFFVARTARARAALYGRDEITPEDVDAAVQLVLMPRIAQRKRANKPDEHDVTDNNKTPHATVPHDMDPRDRTSHDIDPRRSTPRSIARDDASSDKQSASDQARGGTPAAASRTASPDAPADSGRAADQADRADAAPTIVVVPPEDLARVLTIPEQDALAAPDVRLAARYDGSRPAGPIRGVTAARRARSSVAAAPTIAAAVPWQRLRPPRPPAAVRVMPEDLRRYRRRNRPDVLYVLVVDGSGSMAHSRMQLAKGAALAVLQGAYKQRRYVSLVEFRGREATVLCPPGRSATAVRRLITGLGSGGGTPLPTALDVSRRLVAKWRSRHVDGHVQVILFTDGKANVPLHDDAAPALRQTPMIVPEPGEALTATRARRRVVWSDIEKTAASLLSAGVHCHIVDADAAPASAELKRLASLLRAPIIKVSSGFELLSRRK